MTKLCLDTNAYSALMRGESSVQTLLESADSLAVPTVVIGELHAGFAAGRQPQENRKRLKHFLGTPGTEVVPVGRETAEHYGRIVQQLRLQGTPIPTNDIWIAAIAFESGAVLLSLDHHFSVMPLLETIGWE